MLRVCGIFSGQKWRIKEHLFRFQWRDLMPVPILLGIASGPIEPLKIRHGYQLDHGYNVYDNGIRIKPYNF